MGLRDRLFKKQNDTDNSINYSADISSTDVYISYSTKDSEIANKICHVLEQNNLKCWIAPRNLISGKPYSEEITEGIQGSKIAVLVYSRNSQESKYVRNEIQMAFDQNKPIIAFKIDETFPEGEMEYLLRNKHWLDGYPSPEDKLEPLVRDALRLTGKSDNIIPAEDYIKPAAKTESYHGSHDIHISYSSKDKATADAVCHVLEKNGLKCWIAPRNIRSGENYAEQIVEGMKNAKIVVLIFSKNSQESVFVENEIQLAFDYDKPIISFKIDETLPEGKMEYLLKNKHWLDGYPSPEREFERLVSDVSLLLDDDTNNLTSTEKSVEMLSVENAENQKSAEVFISYDNSDRGVAGKICNSLERQDISCWLKDRHVGADSIIDATLKAIGKSKLFVVIFSKHSKHSNYVSTEVNLAFTQNIPIIAFRIDETKLGGGLEFFISNKHWIDAAPDLKSGINNLIKDVLKIIPRTQYSYITFSTPKDTVIVGDVIALSGTLKGDFEQISRGNVNIYQNGQFVDTVISSGSGRFSALIPVEDTGSYDFKAIFKGNKQYSGCESEKITVEVASKAALQQSPKENGRPFKAYDGDEPYMFISYKHADTDLILPIIKRFHEKGYNVWFDHGLQYGDDYDDLIDFKIDESSLFIIFITENVIKGAYNPDEYMKKELDVAIDTGTKIFPIFLHQVGLKGKYRMQLRGKHSIFLHEYDVEDEFIDDCITAFKEDFGIEPSIKLD